MADAIRFGYKELLKANEYFHRLSDKELLALIVQVTGVESDNRTAQMTLAALKVLKSYADFDAPESIGKAEERPSVDDTPGQSLTLPSQQTTGGRVGLNLSYTIT